MRRIAEIVGRLADAGPHGHRHQPRYGLRGAVLRAGDRDAGWPDRARRITRQGVWAIVLGHTRFDLAGTALRSPGGGATGPRIHAHRLVSGRGARRPIAARSCPRWRLTGRPGPLTIECCVIVRRPRKAWPFAHLRRRIHDLASTRVHGAALSATALLVSSTVGLGQSAAPAPLKVVGAFATPIEEPWDGVIDTALKAAQAAGRIDLHHAGRHRLRRPDGAVPCARWRPTAPDIIFGDAFGNARRRPGGRRGQPRHRVRVRLRRWTRRTPTCRCSTTGSTSRPTWRACWPAA